MLKIEILKQSQELQDLTDEQLNAISRMSEADENDVIGRVLREVHDQYDQDILSITGKAKPGGVKTYDHLKSVLTEMKSASESSSGDQELLQKVNDLTAERDQLKAQVDKAPGGADVSSLRQKLQDKEGELQLLRTEKERLESQFEESRSTLIKSRANGMIDRHMIESGVKFNTTLPEGLLKETLNNRRERFLQSLKLDEVDDGQGGKITVVRDDKGDILRNASNNLRPFTVGELYLSKIDDLLDKGKVQGGAGSKTPIASGASGFINMIDVKTQVEADEVIRQHIMTEEGIDRMNENFGRRQKELREEHNVAELPVR